MTLADAISPIALTGSTPTFPDHTAQILLLRLIDFITTLTRISIVGIRSPADPATPDPIDPEPTAPRAQPGPALTLPRRPGWLLAALPDIAPAIAVDLAALLADPALTTLLAAAPTLHRPLRTLLRGLGLTQPPPSAAHPFTPLPRRATASRSTQPHPAPARNPSCRPTSTRSAKRLSTPILLR